MSNFLIDNSIVIIKQRKLNQFRCYLTGAPYATIDDSEIHFALEAMLMNDPKMTLANVLDSWELRALTFSSQILPSLRGLSQHALRPHLMDGQHGHAKLITYMLTRLLYPALDQDRLSPEIRRSRAHFSRSMFETVSGQKSDGLAKLVQELAAIDAYCAMPQWHTLWGFKSAHSKFGLDKAPDLIKQIFDEPETLVEKFESIERLILWMFQLMLNITARDGVAGKSGSKMAQEILVLEVAQRSVTHMPEHQKNNLDGTRQRIQDERAVNTRVELRLAHSATHGKGHSPHNKTTGASASEADFAARILKMHLAKSGEKAAKESKPKVEKPKSAFDAAFANAFAAFVKKD